MKISPCFPLLATVLLAASAQTAEAASPQVAGETSRTAQHAMPTWKQSSFPSRSAIVVGYREMPVRDIHQVQLRNASPQLKATQIGIGRTLVDEGIARTTPALRWLPLKQGGAVARLQVTSPDALALRVGVDVRALHPHVELRFAGSDAPQRVVAAMTAAQASQRIGAAGLYWTPSTDGATQIIEIYRPAHVTALQARMDASQVSHLLTNSRNDFRLAKALGDSGTCNVNAVCRAAELGAPYVQVKNAVARMQFVDIGDDGQTGTYTCSGTLVNDTVPSTQVPYFFSASHCISGQTAATTLNTFWRYESATCGGTTSQPILQLSGGAAYLFADAVTDALLLRLNEPAPAGAEFAGWDASRMPGDTPVIGIHHPSGDLKKVSLGTSFSSSTYPGRNIVGWYSGTTEGGSSGSGIFTAYTDGSYRLRGGLWGGSATCANSTSINNQGNRDAYSRLDLIFPQIQQWLASEPVREHGSHPLARGSGGPVMTNNSAPATAPATPALPHPAQEAVHRDDRRPRQVPRSRQVQR